MNTRDEFSKNMISKQELPTPEEVRKMYPLSDDLKAIKAKNDEEIRKVFTGESDKFI